MKSFKSLILNIQEAQIDALKKKSAQSGIPYRILKQVYDRGMGPKQTTIPTSEYCYEPHGYRYANDV